MSAPPPESSDELSPVLRGLLLRFSAMLERVGKRYGLTGADIDEMRQEIRIRLWTSRAKSEWIAAVSASYMYRTAMTAALTIIRRRRTRTHGAALPLSVAESVAIAGDDASNRLMSEELVDGVASALEALAASRATVVRLYLSGYSREEIAELYGWTEGRTRNLLYRGLDDLRAILASRGIGPDVTEDKQS